ncbi:MAG: tRNA (adenosine(37)-N6)-threonylcarbamoyltransferase complex dimerization subunit type 1 TsaB [Aureliella sp.]
MSQIWQLAIECSSVGGSVALLERSSPAAVSQRVSQICLPSDRGSVQTLAPAVEQVLQQARSTVDELTFLSVTVGPGSFTGLRVGLATAKMLGMACHKPIAPVDTLSAIARRFAAEHPPTAVPRPVRLVTALNTFRRQVFTASWLITAADITNVRPSSVVDAAQWRDDPWASPNAEASDVWLSGSALELYSVPERDATRYHTAARAFWQPLAEHVGELGWQVFDQGGAVSAAELQPNYIRQSAAEEKASRLA